MEQAFPLPPSDADVVFHAVRYYASELLEAFVEDADSALLDDAVRAQEIARQLQAWLVANHQSLMRDPVLPTSEKMTDPE